MELQPEFGYVLVVYLLLFVVYQWMSAKVMTARKKYKVPYPIQRGHQNSLEQLPWLLSFLFVAGVHFPITAAVGGLICVLGRISYFLGYSSGDPDKRMQGMYGYLGLLTLLGCVITAAVSLLRA